MFQNIFTFLVSVAFASSLSIPNALAKVKTPDLTKACAKECPNAANNDQVYKCIETMEKGSGEKAFSKDHKTCYRAHEKYEKITGKEGEEEAHEHG